MRGTMIELRFINLANLQIVFMKFSYVACSLRTYPRTHLAVRKCWLLRKEEEK